MDGKENSRAASLLLRGSLTEPVKPAVVGTPFAARRQPPANNSDGPSPVFQQRPWAIAVVWLGAASGSGAEG
jgi:hypothetical protein